MYDQNDISFNEYSLDFFGFLNYIFQYLFGGGTSTGGEGVVTQWSPAVLISYIETFWGTFVVLSWLASFLLLFGLVYAYIRHNQYGEVFAEILKRQEEVFAKLNKGDVKSNRWRDVETHIESERPNDWKLAIIEADILLGELLDTLGYAGTNIGDKLKSAPPGHFRTINQAWRAHNVRNRIAHEGADFELSKTTARQTVAEYKMVFDEFDFV